MTTILVILSFIFLDGALRIAVIAGLLLFEVVEIAFWLRLRKKRSITGSEAMIGMRGRALTDCRPDGQVWVKGQRWRATCMDGVDAGDDVVVTHLDGLHLEVAPASRATPQPSS